MAIVEPWQIAEIPGPKKASVINKAEVLDAMLKRAKRPVLVVGHLAAEVKVDDKAMIDYLIDLGRSRNIPMIATGNTNLALLDRGYTQATIMTAVDAGQRLSDGEWNGLDGKGPYDMALFVGLPYYMAWTILNGLKHFAPRLRTVSLDNMYHPNASFSFANISTAQWREHMAAAIGRKEGCE
jgi:anaerobic carbon-monoxide dehydrogenase, CODH/ACS complex subunit epsilon